MISSAIALHAPRLRVRVVPMDPLRVLTVVLAAGLERAVKEAALAAGVRRP